MHVITFVRVPDLALLGLGTVAKKIAGESVLREKAVKRPCLDIKINIVVGVWPAYCPLPLRHCFPT